MQGAEAVVSVGVIRGPHLGSDCDGAHAASTVANSRTSIFPVTAAEISAVRRSSESHGASRGFAASECTIVELHLALILFRVMFSSHMLLCKRTGG